MLGCFHIWYGIQAWANFMIYSHFIITAYITICFSLNDSWGTTMMGSIWNLFSLSRDFSKYFQKIFMTGQWNWYNCRLLLRSLYLLKWSLKFLGISITSLLHYFTPSLLHSFIASLSSLHSFTPSLLHSFTASLLHSFIVSLHYFTTSLLHCSNCISKSMLFTQTFSKIFLLQQENSNISLVLFFVQLFPPFSF